MFEYRSKRMWNNSVVFHVVVSALIWVPAAFMVIIMILESGNVATYLFFPSLLIFLALYLYRNSYTKIRFPAVEVCSEHLVLNLPMYNRRVYNLSEIEGAKFIGYVLYFRHLGWPVINYFPSMPKEKRVEFLSFLQSR